MARPQRDSGWHKVSGVLSDRAHRAATCPGDSCDAGREQARRRQSPFQLILRRRATWASSGFGGDLFRCTVPVRLQVITPRVAARHFWCADRALECAVHFPKGRFAPGDVLLPASAVVSAHRCRCLTVCYCSFVAACRLWTRWARYLLINGSLLALQSGTERRLPHRAL